MSNTRNWLKLATLAALLATGAGLAAQETAGFLVVVNAANPASSVTRDDLAGYFLKKASSWEDGQGVVPVDQPRSAAVRAAFAEVVLDRSVRAVAAYWQQQIFSGRSVPPLELQTDQAVVEYVRTHPGAVGYVSTSTDLTGVRTVEVAR